jgi:alpha-mannosidase/mannosylglycerate hydrolase
VELTLEIPADWPEFTDEFGFENKPAFRVFDSRGNELTWQRLGQNRESNRIRLRDVKFPEFVPVREVRIAIGLELPALGYTTLSVRGDAATGERAGQPINIPATRHAATPGIGVSNTCLENEFLRVEAGPGGTLSLHDKIAGETYGGLMEFEDAADIGDGWYHHAPVNDRKCSSRNCASDVALLFNGPLAAALCIRTRMYVPECFDSRRGVRSDHCVELIAESTVTLRHGQRFADIVTRVVNPARDHRLRVLFPSGASAKTFLSDAAFDVVERPVALRADNHLYREMEVEAKPQQSWTAVFDPQRGLAIVSDGALLESGVRDTPERPVLLTLYRSTGRTVMTQGQPNGQLVGHEMTFRYRILPLQGSPDRSELFLMAQELAGGVATCQLVAKDVNLKKSAAALPPADSLLEMTGGGVMTSARMVGTNLEVRIFNPTGREIRSAIRIGPSPDVARCKVVDFLSNPVKFKLTRRNRTVGFLLKPKQILTVSLPVADVRGTKATTT